MSDDLVNRLRRRFDLPSSEAADRIEDLEEKLELMGRLLDVPDGVQSVTPDYIQHCDVSGWPEWLSGDIPLVPVEVMNLKIEALEARLAETKGEK